MPPFGYGLRNPRAWSSEQRIPESPFSSPKSSDLIELFHLTVEIEVKDKDKDIEKVEVEVEVHSSNNSRILSHSGNRSRAGHWVERTFKGEWIAVARKSNLFDAAFVVLSDLLLSLKRSFSGEIPWLEIAIEPDGTSRNRYFESRGDAMA
ncbi:hypothetical protein HZH66_002937 [Vespula vulgaris]|uniref:Uncharacterized protein n=1 Tax=Vespula vulgaris TaxID=7454 RepID=A0A834KKP3_VESVU|nr:hypothetical protein HZH66_002937 [Vespula vulgaris]